jgi:hypothetical protein
MLHIRFTLFAAGSGHDQGRSGGSHPLCDVLGIGYLIERRQFDPV